MNIKDLVTGTRTIRRFDESVAVGREVLEGLVDLARLSASGGNNQPLKYMLSCDREKNAKIFPHLAWAGYLKDWSGPVEGERPAAYIVVLKDTEVSKGAGCDHGIAAQSIMLGATEKGLGGCILGAINRDRIRDALGIPDRYDILLVLALGKPAETVVIDPVGADGSIEYSRDAEGIHHVPKRSLDEIILDL